MRAPPLDQEQFAELGAIGGVITLRIAEEARDFCTRQDLAEPGSPFDERFFTASVMTILETVIFLSITGAHDWDEKGALERWTMIMRSVKRSIKGWNAHQRNTRQ